MGDPSEVGLSPMTHFVLVSSLKRTNWGRKYSTATALSLSTHRNFSFTMFLNASWWMCVRGFDWVICLKRTHTVTQSRLVLLDSYYLPSSCHLYSHLGEFREIREGKCLDSLQRNVVRDVAKENKKRVKKNSTFLSALRSLLTLILSYISFLQNTAYKLTPHQTGEKSFQSLQLFLFHDKN